MCLYYLLKYLNIFCRINYNFEQFCQYFSKIRKTKFIYDDTENKDLLIILLYLIYYIIQNIILYSNKTQIRIFSSSFILNPWHFALLLRQL